MSAALVLVTDVSQGANACEEAGQVVSVEGEVTIHRVGESKPRNAVVEERLCVGDSVAVGGASRAALKLVNNAVLRLDQHTSLRLAVVSANSQDFTWLDVAQGLVQSFSRQPQRMRIDTKALRAMIHGTEFVIRASDRDAEVTVMEGEVTVSNEAGGGRQADAGHLLLCGLRGGGRHGLVLAAGCVGIADAGCHLAGARSAGRP